MTVMSEPWSEHFGSRVGRDIEYLVLHDPGLDQPHADVVARVMRGTTGDKRVSYHRVYGTLKRTPGVFGEVWQVPNQNAAWHSGRASRIPGSAYQNEWVNRASIGLSFTLACPYAFVVAATVNVCREFGLDAYRVYAHREVASLRSDPRQVPGGDMATFRADVTAAL